MTASRYDRMDREWEDFLDSRLEFRRSRRGFAWGAFVIGFVLGAIIF